MSQYIEKRKQLFEERRSNGSFFKGKATTWYLDEYVRCAEKSPIYREACALMELYTHVALPLYPEERVAGVLLYAEPIQFYYGCATLVDGGRKQQYIEEQNLSGEALREFEEKMAVVERHRYHGPDPAVFTPEEMASMDAHAAASTWFGGHMVLDYETVLGKGLDYYQNHIEECRTQENSEFYEALTIMLKAVQRFIERYAQRAQEVSVLPDYDTERFLMMKEDFLWIAHHRPRNFRQALQLVWILHLLNGVDSFGRFDQYMLPFYEEDIRTGRLTREQAVDLLGDFFVKIEEVNQIQSMTIGGITPEGQPAYTDLTMDILYVTRTLGYKGPNLCLRITEEMPETVWKAALDCIGSGIGIPALYNDALYIRSLREKGVPEEHANNYSLAGCSQIMVPGMCNFYNDVGIVNAAKILDLTLYNGYDPRTQKQIGPKTGNPEDFQTFDEFYEAVQKQLQYFCQLETEINNRDTQYRAACEGYAMRTLFMRDCIASGKPIFEGGALYNNIELEIIGLTNMADSLYAVKKAVFEEKIITLPLLVQALCRNYDGAEDLRNRLLRYEKFGNDCEKVDQIRAELTGWMYSYFNSVPTVLGGVFVPGEVIFTSHDYEGQATGATPDGRLAGTVLADSAGASQGKDLHGPTALMNSVLKIPSKGNLVTSVVLNLKFLKTLFSSAHSKIEWLFKTYFAQGGMQLQINVVDAKALEKAIEHPEEYRSLVVRVGGYSDYFVNLSPAIQKDIIERTAQMV